MKTSLPDPNSLVRPLIRKLHGYVPGEQPKTKGLVKLNTNENPYGPSPQVLDALAGALNDRLRLYPNPTAEPLRRRLAQFHRCTPEHIIVGNGSDELLALATRAFVEPLGDLTQYAIGKAADPGRPGNSQVRPAAVSKAEASAWTPSRYTVQYLHPSYSLYPVLAAIHGARPKPVRLGESFELPSVEQLREEKWDFNAALTYITTPHAPSGRGIRVQELENIFRQHRGVLVLDEAYVNFAQEDALGLALRYPHALVARTFSKAYSLCALRVGYFVGHPNLISALHKIRDSYNVNGLGQVAAVAALDSPDYYRKNFRRVIQTREHLSQSLRGLNFEVLPSQSNFLLVRPPGSSAEAWLRKLRNRRILVRWFDTPETRAFLRITIGTEDETEQLLTSVRGILRSGG
jgi:histidinol-phosphate aminotransferase